MSAEMGLSRTASFIDSTKPTKLLAAAERRNLHTFLALALALT